MTAERTVAVLHPRWPVTAAGYGARDRVAVFHANRVVVASKAAEADGVVRGLRRREAQARCPDLVVVQRDDARDARAYDPLVGRVEAFAPRLEVVRPGLCVFAARGPSRYFGGDDALAATVASALGARVGIAEGAFAAALAAAAGQIVEPGATPAFLAPHPVDVLELPRLVDVLARLGIRTLGDLAALPRSDVVARFGDLGDLAHRLASGDDDRPFALRTPPPDLAVTHELEDPAYSVDVATFVAKAAADELAERLWTLGMGCTRLRIEVATEHGEERSRTWRYTSAFTPSAIAERVRWQLEGWLQGADPPTGGLTLLRLHPEDVGPLGSQRGLWGEAADVPDRVRRALHRVQGLLGHEGVMQPVASGGRDPREQVTLVAWGDPLEPARPGLPGSGRQPGPVTVETPPWPGRLPPPSPALVHATRSPAEVVDAGGRPVGVTARSAITAAPARAKVGARWRDVTGWSGPWPCDERWWDTSAHARRARMQVVLADGTAHLLALEGSRWTVEATYD